MTYESGLANLIDKHKELIKYLYVALLCFIFFMMGYGYGLMV